MDVLSQVSDFTRDAQFRIAELTNEILEKKNFEDVSVQVEHRELLIGFLWILVETRYKIFQNDGYNYLDGVWTDQEVITEIQYLRRLTGMSEVPYLEFTNYSPTIINNSGVSAGDLPVGAEGDLLIYSGTTQSWIPISQPNIIGINPSLGIDQVFP